MRSSTKRGNPKSPYMKTASPSRQTETCGLTARVTLPKTRCKEKVRAHQWEWALQQPPSNTVWHYPAKLKTCHPTAHKFAHMAQSYEHCHTDEAVSRLKHPLVLYCLGRWRDSDKLYFFVNASMHVNFYG